MTFSRFMAINMVPLLLRLGLGIVFLWAGSSKLTQHMDVQGDSAALLANLGVLSPPTSAAPTETPPPSPPAESTDPPSPPPADTQPTEPPAGDQSASMTDMGMRIIRVQAATQMPAWTAGDFPDPVRISRRHSVTILLARAATPDENGRQLWPASLASPLMLKSLSWAAALTEALGGVMLIVGFLSRIAALGIASTMLVAMLLTTIGPAIISGGAFLGFLPQPHFSEPNWVQAW